tara:strand:- start:780 stop:998 length:219 start_codon:yes stop_codon:yes gene_type:complete
MGRIFRDINDDQQESLMKTIHFGNTWEMRYFKIKAYFWGTLAAITSATGAAIADYCVFKFTDHAGIIGWLLG